MNIVKMMQQAKKVQQQMAKLQEEIRALEVVGEAGGGMVKVTMRGDHTVAQVAIEPSLFEEDRDLLPDLIAAAINDAVRKLAEAVAEKQKALLAGMPLPPGLGL